MASSSSIGLPVEKLKGMEDYNQWKFMLKMLLMHEDLHDCIEGEDSCKDERKKQKAMAKICLSVGPSALQHVRNAKTPYEAWSNLQRAYEDKGLCRRLGLLRSLFGVKLQDRDGMQSYLSYITELGQQLSDIGSAIEDEFLGIIMLSGLSTDFDPLIMALENSNTKLTSETVRSKLLQEQHRRDVKEGEMNALAVKRPWTVRCFRCKKPGHVKKDCPNDEVIEPKAGGRRSSGKENSLLTALSVKVQNDVWYIDSGATHHMCNNKQIMQELQCSKKLEVNVANGEKLLTEGIGKVKVLLKTGLKTVSEVHYIPKLSANLLSVSELNRKGFSVVFDKNLCKIIDEGEVIATGTGVNGVYELDVVKSGIAMNSACEGLATEQSSEVLETPALVSEQGIKKELVTGESSEVPEVSALVSAQGIDHELWHKRLGHLNARSMKLMKNGLVTGVSEEQWDKTSNYCPTL
ncbi:hypothetical protein JYU34_012495 [Plutella xylostella]|uniref:CCHC-type domain-containing protein n=1 Tax=Plutella xylostella TaxID=51655 RepID=A0ABQ7QBG1_PLUXY|nr:hypothetical protein JYU34_012495 [Plutella xylostella]